jgi:Holliday junction resolvase RusA-like endonuclease
MINEYVKGTPKPAPRPRATVRHGRAFIYNPDTKAMKIWKLAIDAVMSRHAHKGIDGAMSVTLEFYMPRPKSHYRSGRFSHILKADAPLYHTNKNDVDNLCKTVLDRMTESGYIKDDGQVIDLKVSKRYDDVFDAGCKIITEVL